MHPSRRVAPGVVHGVALSANGLRIPSSRALDGRVEPLDAYSAIVVGVADNLTPRVAALRIRGRRGESAGSAVVLSDEGHLITNAHVVASASSGTAEFADGTEARFEVVGTDALSDLAVVRTDRAARRASSMAVRSRSRSWGVTRSRTWPSSGRTRAA